MSTGPTLSRRLDTNRCVARIKYTREVLSGLAAESRSVSELLVKLGLRISGGSHAHIRSRLNRFGIDTSHFRGKSGNFGLDHRGGPQRVMAEERLVLRDPSRPPLSAHSLRSALLEIGCPHRCELCGLATEWLGRRLVLQIDHCNGRHFDNRPENLRFLCPNCHSQTASFGRKNRAYQALVAVPLIASIDRTP